MEEGVRLEVGSVEGKRLDQSSTRGLCVGTLQDTDDLEPEEYTAHCRGRGGRQRVRGVRSDRGP